MDDFDNFFDTASMADMDGSAGGDAGQALDSIGALLDGLPPSDEVDAQRPAMLDEALLEEAFEDLEDLDIFEETNATLASAAEVPALPSVSFAVPTFAELYRTNLTSTIQPSTERGIVPMFRYWHIFCSYLEPPREPFYWDGKGLHLFWDDGSFKWDLARIFVKWLTQHAVTNDNMKKVKTFLNSHAKAEARATNIVMPPEVGADTDIQRMIQEVRRRQGSRARDNGEDLQADIDNKIPESQRVALVMAALKSSSRTINRMQPLTRVQFAAQFNKTFATARRGEELRDMVLSLRFVREMRTIGPNGTLANMNITNKAKHNQVGRIEYIAYVAHRNPLLDSVRVILLFLSNVYLSSNYCFLFNSLLGMAFVLSSDLRSSTSHSRTSLTTWTSLNALSIVAGAT